MKLPFIEFRRMTNIAHMPVYPLGKMVFQTIQQKKGILCKTAIESFIDISRKLPPVGHDGTGATKRVRSITSNIVEC